MVHTGWERPVIDEPKCKLYLVYGIMYKEFREKDGDGIWYEEIISTKKDFIVDETVFDPELAVVSYEENIKYSKLIEEREKKDNSKPIEVDISRYPPEYETAKYIPTWSTSFNGVLRKIKHEKEKNHH
jgi:hypothetical protein